MLGTFSKTLLRYLSIRLNDRQNRQIPPNFMEKLTKLAAFVTKGKQVFCLVRTWTVLF